MSLFMQSGEQGKYSLPTGREIGVKPESISALPAKKTCFSLGRL
jgi:hypothetical protein